MVADTTEETLQLADIPDLSSIEDPARQQFEDGWYEGTILEVRQFTDKMGNDRVFASEDQPSQAGDSRNIRLQIELKRKSDNAVFNNSVLVNYRPEDLSAETVAAVTSQLEANKKSGSGQGLGPLFRSFMTLKRLGTLQKIAGVRQLQRNSNGGLNLTPLYNKKAYFRLGPDDRKPEFKAIVDYRETAPVKAKVL